MRCLLTGIHRSLLVDWPAYFFISLLYQKLHCSSPKYYTSKTKTNTIITTVDIDFRIEDTNKEKGVYYDDLNVMLNFIFGHSLINLFSAPLYYAPNLSSPIGNSSISGFYQKSGGTLKMNLSFQVGFWPPTMSTRVRSLVVYVYDSSF
ncbi:hypothetical protein NE237_015959 [Protea cynaroides]|uniref:Uncharacterized protein n=1 Tax=Protea cynaroides TaxID=273540 RepID=A0A9Q0KEQ7_9MAGN|nr:hypothetical protein NE237_015959 [Protea cynaroides]